MNNCLGLELRVDLRIDGRYPKVSAKADDGWLSAPAGSIDENVGPVASSALWTVTNICHYVTCNQISDSRQSADHFRD